MKRGAKRRSCWFLTADQAEACLELWASGRFDTVDIARLLSVPEHAICRTIQAARDIAREIRRESQAS